MILTTILMSAALAAQAGQAKLSASSRIWLEGDSTMHAFASTATAVDFNLTLDSAKPLAEGARAAAPGKMTLKIPVAALKSAHKGLDENLRKALKADKNPDILFEMNGYRVDGASITATGSLTVAGVTKPQNVTGAFLQKGTGLVIDGSKDLLMTDFGVTPPKMMMGAIKTADKVVIKFHLELTE